MTSTSTVNGDAGYTPLDEIEKVSCCLFNLICMTLKTWKIHNELKAAFLTGKTRDIAYRKQQLLQLGYMLHDNISRFDAALTADLGRSSFDNNL